MYQLQSPAFLIAFKILLEILTNLRGLTTKLQMQTHVQSFMHTRRCTPSSILSILKNEREHSSVKFKKIFTETKELGKKLHGDSFELLKPRIVGRQAHRHNPEMSSPEDYYRITLYHDFLSHVIAELQERFLDCSTHGNGLLNLLPTSCIGQEATQKVPMELAQSVQFYKSDLPHSVMFSIEYRMWVRKWNCFDAELPVDTLKVCCHITFPNIYVLLQLALTLPITSCESERSFSQLKLIKTPHRSTMSGERLSGLALMKINRAYCELLHSSPDKLKELTKLFGQLHPRRMKLPNVFVQ